MVTATGRKYGLHVTASRTVCFGEPPDDLKQEHNAVVRVSAGYLASTWPDAVPREILLGRPAHLPAERLRARVAPVPAGARHRPAGRRDAAAADDADPARARLGHHLVRLRRGRRQLRHLPGERTRPAGDDAHRVWPLKRIRIQGAECIRPDVLVR